jgi:hypothetical protein
MGILQSIDPPRVDINSYNLHSNSEDYILVERCTQSRHSHRAFTRDHVEKKEKQSFWNRNQDKEKEKAREREREREKARERDGRVTVVQIAEDPQPELTRMFAVDFEYDKTFFSRRTLRQDQRYYQ